MKSLLLCSFFVLSIIGCKKGDSTDQSPNYTNVKILKTTVTGIPFTNANGGGWDVSNGPDVYFTINDPLGNELIKSPTTNDVIQSKLPLSFNFIQAMQITNLATRFSFNLFDYDFPDADDYMGGYYFTMNDYKSGYPKVITFQSPNSSIKLEFNVEWY